MIGTIILFLVVMSVLIFVHELGHFLTAKWSGIRVNEFALGMGPKLISRTKGETTYSLRAFPIGGFCAMEGENEDSEDKSAFCNAPLSRRILVTVAGSLMNLLLGLIMVGILSTQLQVFGSTVVADFKEGAVSHQYLEVGDQIVRMNGHRVRTLNDIDYEFSRVRDGIIDMQVIRDGETINLPAVVFEMQSIEDVDYIYMDFRVAAIERTPKGVLVNTFNWTLSLIKQLWGSLIDLATGRYSVKVLSGPVGVASAIGQASSMGWRSVMLLVSIITLNLGLFNLLPIPALDGGRLIFLLVELVRRKPIDPKYEGFVHAAGFILLIGLMIFVTFNDVIKLIQS